MTREIDKPNRFIRLQAEHHELMKVADFKSIEDYGLFLVHRKAYEVAAGMADGKEVLDIGCNVGYGTNIIGTNCKSIIGVDVSQIAIEEARRRYITEKMDFMIVDGMFLPFKDGSFDMVVSYQVIEHIHEYEAYLSEIVRVLRPRGMALFSTPNSLVRLEPDSKPWNTFHAREFNPTELRELLQERFSKVMIKGLFAKEPLYSIELERVKRMRDAARGTAKLRDRLYDGMKLLIPASVRNAIRYLRYQNRTQVSDSADLQRYSTADLFYRDNDIDRSLDLLAICEKK